MSGGERPSAAAAAKSKAGNEEDASSADEQEVAVCTAGGGDGNDAAAKVAAALDGGSDDEGAEEDENKDKEEEDGGGNDDGGSSDDDGAGGGASAGASRSAGASADTVTLRMMAMVAQMKQMIDTMVADVAVVKKATEQALHAAKSAAEKASAGAKSRRECGCTARVHCVSLAIVIPHITDTVLLQVCNCTVPVPDRNYCTVPYQLCCVHIAALVPLTDTAAENITINSSACAALMKEVAQVQYKMPKRSATPSELRNYWVDVANALRRPPLLRKADVVFAKFEQIHKAWADDRDCAQADKAEENKAKWVAATKWLCDNNKGALAALGRPWRQVHADNKEYVKAFAAAKNWKTQDDVKAA